MRGRYGICLVAVLASLLLASSGPVGYAELIWVRLLLSLQTREPLDSKLAFVVIDQESQEKLGRFPWKRSVHARLLDELHRGGARWVAMDISFAHATEAAEDQVLAEALRNGPPVVLAQSLEQDASGHLLADKLEPGIKSSAEVASVRVYAEADGHVYQARLADHLTPLGRRLAELDAGAEIELGVPEMGRAPRWGGVDLEARGQGNWILLDPPSKLPRFYSYFDVLEGRHQEAFRDRIVLVGSGMDANDMFSLPVPVEVDGSSLRRLPGFVYHAVVAHTLWNRPLTKVSGFKDDRLSGGRALGLGMVLLSWLAFFRWGPKVSTTIGWSAVVAFPLVGLVLFFKGHTLVPCFKPVSMLLINIVAQQLWGLTQIRRLLSRFIPKEQAHSGRLASARETLATVVFIDLRDYTSWTEELGTRKTRELMEAFHGAVSTTFQAHGGYVADFQGDGQMVVFGLGDETDHGSRALAAAAEVGAAIAAIEVWHKGENLTERLGYGVGICSGEVSVGYLGSDRHSKFSILGDAVNTAARLQDLSKTLGTVVVSHSTAESVDNDGLREAGEYSLKGKREPHRVYLLERL